MGVKVQRDYRIRDDYQSLEELWESISKQSARRVQDNSLDNEYPLDIRKRQIESILTLANAIKTTHSKIEEDQTD